MANAMTDGREWQFTGAVLEEKWVARRLAAKAKAIARRDSRNIVCLITRDLYEDLVQHRAVRNAGEVPADGALSENDS